MTDSVQECERDVERAREKFRKDLSTLRSPATFSSFTDELKAEAFEAKDAVVARAKDTVRTNVEAFIDDAKARAAANPAAALAIGAGIAWQLLRHPPITSLLVGAGVLSLWRTTPSMRDRDTTEYLDEGKRRLREQVSGLGDEVTKVVAESGRAIAERAEQASEAAARTVADLTSRASVTARGAAAVAREAVSDAGDQATVLARQTATRAEALSRETLRNVRGKIGRPLPTSSDMQDKLLLGVAGLAVAGALGIAFQKRAAERSDVSNP
jgi:ElaB/YqjD/DUF883 family membrane-anchored ribosome-binding protein